MSVGVNSEREKTRIRNITEISSIKLNDCIRLVWFSSCYAVNEVEVLLQVTEIVISTS